MYRTEFPAEARLGRDKFEDLMAHYGLKVRNKPRRVRTTDSNHGLPLYPNMVRELIPERVNQLWTSDITYIPLFIGDDDRRFCYLSLITDAYSHEIVGWAVGLTLDAHYPLMALEMALTRLEGGGERPIHHSDRGIQYACKRYTKTLSDNGIRISMTESGDPKENAYAERVNSTIKNELLKGRRFHSLADVRAAMRDAVDFYNNRRPHMSVDMLTPAQAATLRGEIPKKWHSFRETAIKKNENVVGNS